MQCKTIASGIHPYPHSLWTSVTFASTITLYSFDTNRALCVCGRWGGGGNCELENVRGNQQLQQDTYPWPTVSYRPKITLCNK